MRSSRVERRTNETQVSVLLTLEGEGEYTMATTIPFLDHMLGAFAKHGLYNLTVEAQGDTEVDDHHLVEDVGIVLGEAFAQALGEKVGLARFGHAVCPLDEALVRCAVDFSGRPYLVYKLSLKQKRVGTFDTELAEEFYKGFAMGAACNLHLAQLEGRNSHHILEASFKAFAVATRDAVRLLERAKSIPSTKGVLK